ncbi:MAG: DinB family protein [Sediminicola sp.]|tara:strand:+ start:106650 stop:107174 length:525 start_codon:yes stop_codon:yes gene_type:complete
MEDPIKFPLWRQFGASIDMLINVIAKSPDDFFIKHKRFYYIAYHSTLFLDYYSTFPPKDFSAMLPFTQMEMSQRPQEAIDDLIPDRIYSKKELLRYLLEIRAKCKNLVEGLTDDKYRQRFSEGNGENDMDYPILEIFLYNMRHTQHHVAQLNLLVRQELNVHMEWSFREGDIQL